MNRTKTKVRKAQSFAKAGKMAMMAKLVDKPFFIDDNVSVTVLTNSPGKKIIGFEAKWKKEKPTKFMVEKEKRFLPINEAGVGTFYHKTILQAFKAMEAYFLDKKLTLLI